MFKIYTPIKVTPVEPRVLTVNEKKKVVDALINKVSYRMLKAKTGIPTGLIKSLENMCKSVESKVVELMKKDNTLTLTELKKNVNSELEDISKAASDYITDKIISYANGKNTGTYTQCKSYYNEQDK